ncbi:acetyl-CoA acetyltransferase [Oceanicola sp. 502str15]|uniref:acetyl-CoA acetyltransferase n=1 Tax=Oceanicola sp. 502str15 TaxID=2696061 RepID=UPI002095C831|nr:acetyl-CoA acetyltransferase [Oceanicola sp. 502str15]MCO6383618.1 acetyl-CoA acetyltransferase [Oceanicola sp. 502str15]
MADHPFHAVMALAEARGIDRLKLVEHPEQDGYTRLISQGTDLLFKAKADPGSNIDRIGFSHHERIDLTPEQIAQGPEALLADLLGRIAAAEQEAQG